MNLDEILKQLTLTEKCALLQGWTTWTTRNVDRLNIPALFLADGPTGLRKQAGAADHLGLNESVPATCFPTSATVCNSWDVELGEAVGRTIGAEAAVNDVHTLLGPGLNIKRSPLCGRNFEYFSEDPYLAGKMAAAYVRGIQQSGPAACPKHFAVNSQELRRMSMDSVVDERTLREIYLTAFEIAVKEGGAKALMTSYNMVNGIYANENRHLLTDILRSEWGYGGYVMTDWGGDNDHVEGVRNGSNLVMPAPGANCALELRNAVQEGRISEGEVDVRVREFLEMVQQLHSAGSNTLNVFHVDAHHAVARRAAEGSIVLLDNDGILPLDPGAEVVMIGDFVKQARYQGAGSSQVNPTKLDNLYDCAKEAGLKVIGYAQGFSRLDPDPRQDLIDEAVELAKGAKTVLLCVGLDEILESEGMDRLHMDLSKSQQVLIDAVAQVNRNVILVLSGGSPFVMPHRSKYRAAIHGYLGGQAGAGAMADALAGRVNPSGKLNETWPLCLADNPSANYFPSKERTAEHREGLFIGYRYYDTAGVPVRYPFGYGLSYTSFAYSDLQVSGKAVTFTLENTGDRDGAEVAQIYVSCKNGRVFRAKKELKGFVKVFLRAGARKTITVALDDKAFRYFNIRTNRWEVETADYEISVAANVSDIRLSQTLPVLGTDAPDPYGRLPSYETGQIQNVSNAEFELLLDHAIPDGRWGGELTANDAICQLYYAKSGLARLVCKILTNRKEQAEAKGKPDLNIMFIYNMPFRAIGKMAGGMVSAKMVEDILFIVNGHFWRGLGRLIADFFRNQQQCKAYLKELEG